MTTTTMQEERWTWQIYLKASIWRKMAEHENIERKAKNTEFISRYKLHDMSVLLGSNPLQKREMRKIRHSSPGCTVPYYIITTRTLHGCLRLWVLSSRSQNNTSMFRGGGVVQFHLMELAFCSHHFMSYIRHNADNFILLLYWPRTFYRKALDEFRIFALQQFVGFLHQKRCEVDLTEIPELFVFATAVLRETSHTQKINFG